MPQKPIDMNKTPLCIILWRKYPPVKDYFRQNPVSRGDRDPMSIRPWKKYDHMPDFFTVKVTFSLNKIECFYMTFSLNIDKIILQNYFKI